MYDAPNGSTKYYIIEQTGVIDSKRYVKTLGKQFLINEDPDLSQDPTWGYSEHAFKFDSYTSACHWLLRWKPVGTHRLVYVEEEQDDKGRWINRTFKYVMDGPVDQERFDERDWKEYHHMNGKSN
jgi:hypothetical protein